MEPAPREGESNARARARHKEPNILSDPRANPAAPGLPRTALVTGAGGFVGSNLVRHLLSEGWQVRAYVRPSAELSSLEGLPLEVARGELADSVSLREALAGVTHVFHLAASLEGSVQDLYETNVAGTRVVLECAVASGCRCIVHTSTIGTLGREDGAPARETDSWLPPGASDYARSKREGERVAREMARQGAPIVIVHPSAPVGPWDRVPTVSGRRILEVLAGKVPRYPACAVNHVAVGDVARGMLLAAEVGRPGSSYILGHAAGNLTRDAFVALVAGAAGMERPPRQRRGLLRTLFLPPRPSAAGPRSLACDPTWSIEALGLPQTPLEEAFREAVRWFRAARKSPEPTGGSS